MKDFDRQIIRRLLDFSKVYKPWFISAILFLLLATGAQIALPVILQKAVDEDIAGPRIRLKNSDEFLQNFPGKYKTFRDKKGRIFLSVHEIKTMSPQARQFIQKGRIQSLKKKAGLYALLLILILAFSFAQIFTITWTSQGVMRDIRLSMLNHVIRQPLSWLGSQPVGSLVSRIGSDVETINEFFTSVLVSLLADLAIMTGVLLTLFFLNPLLAGITLLTLPPVMLGTLIFRLLARSAYRRQRHWTGRVNSFLSEHIAGMEVIQIFGRQGETKKEFSKNNQELYKASMAELYLFSAFRPLVNLFSSVSLGIIIHAGAGFVNQGHLSLGVLIAFIDLIQKFYKPVMNISEKISLMQSAMAGGERVFQLLDENHSLEDSGSFHPREKIKGELEFKKVNFSYRKGEPILKDLSFKIKPGETVALLGPTGAGKTTIASLAARLWEVDSGEILLDGVPIQDYPLKQLRSMIQGVSQDAFLFSATIEENITMGLPLTKKDLRRITQSLQADDFIMNMEKAYDTLLQEQGRNLSAGQRQLLSFARALAHNPPVLILDEATASIDAETERKIQAAMEKILDRRSALIIAHRLSTIEKADRILVLSEGKLAEEGTHQGLLARQGLYAKLHRYQYALRKEEETKFRE